MYPDLKINLSTCPALLANISQSFVTLCQKGKSFEVIGKSMQDSTNLTLNYAQHENIQTTMRVSYLVKEMFQTVKVAKFPNSD